MATALHGFTPTKVQVKLIEAVENFIRSEFDVKLADGLPMFDHTHLDLSDSTSFSTHFEDTFDPSGVAESVSEAIFDKKIELPGGYFMEMYSSMEMYFYKG